MIQAGEDPRFILRRLVVLAGEDIGLADPQGLVVATAAVTAFEFIGMPEGIYPIAEATLYLATAPKSNSAGAYFRAAAEIQEHGTGPVPVHLMDASRDAKGFGHGQGYLYPHEFPGHHVAQQYLPSNLLGTVFYQPSDQGYEARIAERLERLRKAQAEGLAAKQQEKHDDPSTHPPRRE
jgi:putative ATPase